MTQTKAEQLAEYIESASPNLNDKLIDAGKELRRLSPMEADAKRYQWLKTRLLGADFDWQETGDCVLVFEFPSRVGVGGNCDMNIDAAMEALAQTVGEKK
jgi:hypothetical protein